MKPYTAICGKYPIARDDIVCFTSRDLFQRPVMEAKRYKVLPHQFLPDDVTIWLDGNVWLTVEPRAAIEELLDDADIALFNHPYRATVWEEFEALSVQQRFQIPYLQEQLKAQAAAYRSAGLPNDARLFECSVLIRRNNEQVNRVMDAWWAQLCRWQWRDQVSLPYVLWKHGAELNVATHHINVRDHAMFRYVSQH